MNPILPPHRDLWQSTLGWLPDERQQQEFQALYEALLTGNQQLNLTRLTTPEDFWEKHLWDSLRGIQPWLAKANAIHSAQVIDIGTGGGFPGLPVAIAQSGWTVTLLDATRKKVAFLAEVGQRLGLETTAIAQRAEILGRQAAHREHYDIAFIRAVGPAATCAEYALPLLKVGGTAVLYRGQLSPEDTATLQQVIPSLGGNAIAVDACATPITHAMRHYVRISKTAPTPEKFPRAVGVPAKSPLR